MTPRNLLGCVVACAALLSGCSMRAPNFPPAVDLVLPAEEVGVFDHSAQLLDGFDPVESDQSLRTGDRVLFGLAIQIGKQTTVRYALVTVKVGLLANDSHIAVLRPGEPSPEPKADVPNVVVRHAIPEGHARTPLHFDVKPIVFRAGIRGAGGVERRFQSSSRCALVAVEIYDENIAPVATSFVIAPEAYLRASLYHVATRMRAYHRALDADFESLVEQDPPAYQRLPEDLFTMYQTVLGLEDLVNAVLRRPKVFMATLPVRWMLVGLLPGRHTMTLRPALNDLAYDVTEFIGPVGDDPPIRMPIDLALDGLEDLRCTLHLVPPMPPYQLCAGVLGIDVQIRGDENRSVHARLLAARRVANAGLSR